MAMYYYATKLSAIACGVGCASRKNLNNQQKSTILEKKRDNKRNHDEIKKKVCAKIKIMNVSYIKNE